MNARGEKFTQACRGMRAVFGHVELTGVVRH